MSYLMPVRIVLLSACIAASAVAQTPTKAKQQILLLKRTIELNHYQPRPIDDTFSGLLFDRFFENVDPGHDILLPADQKELLTFRYRLDDELNGNGWNFLDRVTNLLKQRLQHKDSMLIKQNDKTGEHRQIRKMLNEPKGFDFLITQEYCDALANAFDPHTEYMPPAEKKRFESQLSSDGYYYGFSLDENDKEETEIARVMPGSPAWKCGELNTGDVLVRVTQPNGKVVDLVNAAPDEISEILDASESNSLNFTVRKANGTEKTVSLKKEKMQNEENSVRGYLLKSPHPVGYIYLPDFYSADNRNSGGSANDVAKEVVKLKRENIEGLILDLRFNGGGSLQEALDMAGIFIDAGPLTIIRDNTGKTSSLKDANVGTIYDGPLTLLVNSQSASASELLAAVLQDYHRALIVGCTTYGKGTAQVIMPVDTTGHAANGDEYGYVKVTINKFYRVNGKTTQNTGVIPDIALPDLFDKINYHESASPSALLADTVKRNMFYRPLAELPLADLSQKSAARVLTNKDFQAIRSLSLEPADSLHHRTPAPGLELQKTDLYQAVNNQFDQKLVASDGFLSDTNARWIERLDHDDYVIETFSILQDLIQHKTP